jgi:hypothetical protein
MQQTASSKKQRTPEEQPQTAAAHNSDEGLGQEALEERYLYDAPPSGGFLGVAFERFLQEPLAVVAAVLWVVFLAWLSLLVLTIYMLGTSLASSMAAGV